MITKSDSIGPCARPKGSNEADEIVHVFVDGDEPPKGKEGMTKHGTLGE